METIDWSKTSLGIELGSTRIKATLLSIQGEILAEGESKWENHFQNGLWTYPLEEVKEKLQECYLNLKKNIRAKYRIVLSEVGSIGISAMMHGYLVFDKNGKQLAEFRTWRNNNAIEASSKLSQLFSYPVPARYSISHLYQAILNQEKHVPDISFETTLAGYVHSLLTNEKVLGIGDASGMFPINSKSKDYDESCLNQFNEILESKGLNYHIEDIFPKVLLAGQIAGYLTEKGALLLDPEGDLKKGIPFCPPEGDAETGMVATNSVLPLTGNISAGTSIFGMIVLKNRLKRVHPQIDIVTTPTGEEVAMVHCNNCTSELNSWVSLFQEYGKLIGKELSTDEVFSLLFQKSKSGEEDCGKLLSYNYLSGENLTSVVNGRPLLVRTPDSSFTLSNFMRAQVYSCFATLKFGFDMLKKEEDVEASFYYATGGIFQTEGVAEEYLSAALNTDILLSISASNGGSYGMALLAQYLFYSKRSLSDYLSDIVFAEKKVRVIKPNPKTVAGFNEFEKRYLSGLSIEKEASNWED